ncbi:ABC transporter substrate-binding protein [Homoserinibacter sp. YIM 151385]|uniref:ABC transporter substrate-binding protein n=1 Tax=Homoserinibacter sp. YIM 151385 TaxID=2985506 RepID=UPI0022F0ADB7|nr:ABC transporter substrate-binding protein [Homoserinibacter sp. YIM 151385]WBU37097.1 ABC transporter substrate-binding protein [Homoserinibacter sp. YIM 151385]
MKKQHLAPAVIAVAVLGLTAGCTGGGDDGADGRQSITMAMAAADTYTAEWWGWLAADELGYYDDLGLDVDFVATGGSGDAMEQIIAGNADAGNPSAPAFGEAALVGLPVVNMFTYSSGAIFGIFVPESEGISDIAGLKGKNIGISEPGGGEVAFLEAALRDAGIDPITEVQLIPIGDGGPETLAALDSGSVDAYSTAYNDIFALQTAGYDLLDFTPDIYNTFPARGIITTQSVIDQKPEALQAFARGTAMGIYFCLQNEDACRDMMKGAIPAAFEPNADGVSQGDLRFDLSLEQVPPADEAAIGAHDTQGTQEFLDLIRSTSDEYQETSADSVLNSEWIEYANDFDRDAVAQDAADYELQNG